MQHISYVDKIHQVHQVIQSNPGKLCIVTDDQLAPLYLKCMVQALQINTIVITCIVPSGEQSKNIKQVEQIIDTLFQNQFTRADLVIGMGGGVITDLVGFTSSIYMRGIKFIYVPTTLLAMADAAVGGKTGVNNKYGKNQIGVINDPYAIIVCPEYLHTLDKRNFLNGMAEVIKIAATCSLELFEQLESTNYEELQSDYAKLFKIVKSAVQLKQSIVVQDKYEQNIRKTLNYGHTIGHAIESTAGDLLHGECVSIGIVYANRLFELIKQCKQEYSERIYGLLKQYGLPTELPKDIDCNRVIEYMLHDKKNHNNQINFIFIDGIGQYQPFTTGVNKEVIINMLGRQCELYNGIPNVQSAKLHGSKSIANRVLLLSALSQGTSVIKNMSSCEDCDAMMDCLQELKLCTIVRQGDVLLVTGRGIVQSDLEYSINVRESGTTGRFILPVAALVGNVRILGAQRMYERPIVDLVDALKLTVEYIGQPNHFPFVVGKWRPQCRIQIKSKVSSQYVSAILMAAPLFEQDTIIEIIDNQNEEITSEAFIMMTIQLMHEFGIVVDRISRWEFLVKQGQYRSIEYSIEPDATALTYDIMHIALNGGQLDIPITSKLQGDIRFIDAMLQMGMRNENGILMSEGSVGLKAIEFNCIDCSDTFISLALIMGCVSGVSVITGIGNQRVKECDRVSVVANNLNSLGITTLQEEDKLIIYGKQLIPQSIHRRNIIIQTYNDHRIAMAFSILGGYMNRIQYRYNIVIDNKQCVNKTFPEFYQHISGYGIYNRIPQTCSSIVNKYHWIKEPIYLIGMRGAGKSTLSKQICIELGFEYISIDDMISNNITEYVNNNGIEQFRRLEKQCLINVMNSNPYNCIIDCGGGIIEDIQIQQILYGKCVVFIDKHIDEIIVDLQQQQNRPNIGDAQQVYQYRLPIYQQLAKYTFSIPTKQQINDRLINNTIDQYYQQILSMFSTFIKQIVYLINPKHKIYATNTSFVCIFYDELETINEQDIDIINKQHNAMEIRIDKCVTQYSLQDIIRCINSIKYFLKIPLIITLRSESQGGFYNGNHNNIIIDTLIKSFIWDYFDIEYDLQIDLNKFNDNQVILSQHFIAPCIQSQIINIINRISIIAQDKHDIVALIKIIIHQDVYPANKICTIQHNLDDTKYIIPYLILPMGINSSIYRVLNNFMIPLAYRTPTAHGQLNYQQQHTLRQQCNYECKQSYHIFGSNVSQSRSPTYHNQQFNALHHYHQKLYTQISIPDITMAQQYIDSQEFQGASVTMPFKELIGQYVHQKSSEVECIGNVINTIIKYNDRLIGFNTDWWGIYYPIYQAFPKQSTRTCLIIGNGATAKTALFVAKHLLDMKVSIYGRNPQKVTEFAKEHQVQAISLQDQQTFSLVISTVPAQSTMEYSSVWFEQTVVVMVAHQDEDALLKYGKGISGKVMFELQAIGQRLLFSGK